MNSDITIDKKFFDAAFPLLDKFRELAPGTYKHCQNVSNICETIGVDLGLHSDVLKCAALYHDVGKMNNPLFFSENQGGKENVHDKLDPYLSYHTITRHVGDSVLHLLQLNMPHEVIEVVSQHHGTTVLKAFYSKAQNEPEDKFRYKSSKPISTEAAVLMIVDSVEATAKSMSTNNQEDEEKSFITMAINGTIDRLVDDGQLDNMKIGTLKIVKRVLFKELEMIYHKRVIYDDDQQIGEANGIQ